jgi:hypothetical protein
MAAFADYLDLRFAVSDHVGNRSISDVMPRLVQMAESSLNRKLRTRQQITYETLTLVSGSVALPTDFLEMLHVFGDNGKQLRAGSLADIQREGSQYYRYAIDGSNLLIKGYSGDRDIEYYAALPTLTTSASTTNWLLADYPEVYLYAVGLEAAKFLKDADLGVATNQLLDAALSSVKIDDDRARWANTTVRVQGCTP